MSGLGWMRHAACRSEDLGLFFGPDGEQPAARDAREAAAKAVCSRCRVRSACLADALERGARHGVLGGTTPAERKQLRRSYLRRMRRNTEGQCR